MIVVNNNTIAEVADVVFANSSSYYVQLPMVGRDTETAVLLDVLSGRGDRQVVSIEAPLGAGKTFFLNTVFGLHGRTDPTFDERRNVHFLLATDLEVPDDFGLAATAEAHPDRLEFVDLESPFRDVSGRHVLVVEELDRKASLGQIRWSLAAALAWLRRRTDRVLVVTGDATVGGRHVNEFLSASDNPQRLVLDPLDLDLLKLALRTRIQEKLLSPAESGADPLEIEEQARNAADAVLGDDYVRWSAVPPTTPPMLATFRDAFGVLRIYAENAPTNTEAVFFDGRLVRLLPDVPSGLTGASAQLEAALYRVVKEAVADDAPLPSFTLAELAALAGHDLTPSYGRGIVRPLVRKALLLQLGVPYESDESPGVPSAFAEPFMPSYRLVHRSLKDLIVAGDP